MSSTPVFYQECPTCGRHLRIRVEHLGRQMTCVHCNSSFVAVDRESRMGQEAIGIPSLLDRAEDLLGISASRSLAEL